MLVLNQVEKKKKKKLDLGPLDGAADPATLKLCCRSALVLLVCAESSSFEFRVTTENVPARSAPSASVGVQLAVVSDGLTTLEILGNISNSLKHHIVACFGPLTSESTCIYWMQPFFSIYFSIVKINTWNELVVTSSFESQRHENVSVQVIFQNALPSSYHGYIFRLTVINNISDNYYLIFSFSSWED